VLGLPRAEIADCDRAAAIVLLGPDLEEELPVLHLRVRRAAVELGFPLSISRRRHTVCRSTRRWSRDRAGEELGAAALAHIAQARGDRPGPVVVVLGRASLSSRRAVLHAGGSLVARRAGRLFCRPCGGATCTARSTRAHAGFLPGRVSLDAGREWFAAEWGDRIPRGKGLDAQGILEAAAAGKIEVL